MHRLLRAFRRRQQHLVPPRWNRLQQRRSQSQIAYKRNGEPIRYQAVRFKRPGFTYRRAVAIGLYGGAIYGSLQFLGKYLDVHLEVLDGEEGEGEGKEGEGEEEDDGYADEDSNFIPMTWATKMPRTFYRGSDPEWQDFVKVAKDKQRRKKIQDELVQIVYTGSVQHPVISKQLGNETKLGKYWLDISFPDGPPQEFERSGIEIGDGFVAWSQQRISSESHWRLMRAIYPKAAFDSIWATTKVLGGIQYRRLKQALGWEDKDPFSPEKRYKHALEMMQKQQAAREQKEVGNAKMEPDGSHSAVVGSSTASEAQPSHPSTEAGKRSPWQIRIPMPYSPSINSTDIPIGMHVFSSTLAKQWNPTKMEPPRGSFVVQGLVEVRGQKGRMLFDVQSCYDPKVGKFVAVSAGVRNFKPWKQAPRGGP